MYQIEIRDENEIPKETMKYIESKRNWDVANQRYRKPEAENCKANISECEVYWRGKYLILEHDGVIHYWDSFPYCFLKQAVEFFEIDKPAKWKTLNKLIDLRMAIRQTEVNLCGYVETMLVGEEMTLKLYKEFMEVCREQDLQHHGSHTF